MQIRLDGVVVFKGDVARADGSSLSTTVWFTADVGVRARVEASDPRRSSTPKTSTMGTDRADRAYENGVPGASVSPDTASAHAFFDDDSAAAAAAASGGYSGGGDGGARGRAGVRPELEAHPLLQADCDDDGGGGGGGAQLRWGGFLDVGAGGAVVGANLAVNRQAGGGEGAVTPRPRTGARSRGAVAGLGARDSFGSGGEGSVRGLSGLGVSQSVTSLPLTDSHTGSRIQGDATPCAGEGGGRDGLSSGAPVRPSTAASLRRQRPLTCKVFPPLCAHCICHISTS